MLAALHFGVLDEGLEFVVGGHDDAALVEDGGAAFVHFVTGVADPGPLPAFVGDEEAAAFIAFANHAVGLQGLRGEVVDAFGGLCFGLVDAGGEGEFAVLLCAFDGMGHSDGRGAWCAVFQILDGAGNQEAGGQEAGKEVFHEG
jgi:hypothetical protein